MKPRNKFESLIAGYSLQLQKDKPLTKHQKNWAIKTVHDKYFTTHYSNNICLECTHKFKTTEGTKQELRRHGNDPVHVNCPKCGCKLKYTARFYIYGLFSMYDVCNGHQVERMFAINKILEKGKEPTYFFSEVVQKWINEKGKIAIMSKKRVQYYNDMFYYHGDLSINDFKAKTFNYKKPLLDLYSVDVYPESNVLPILERNGFVLNQYINHNIFSAMYFHLTDNFFESLVKIGQINLAIKYMYGEGDNTKKYFNQIRICSKNQYVIEKPGDYFDYLSLLEYFQKDLNSPKYLCPENFEQAHGYWVDRKTKEDAELTFKDLQKEERKYIRAKKRFFSFRIEAEDIVIKPAESIKEFIEAGDRLKHCIMTNKYYEKPSLILMVEKSGKLIETAEVKPKQGVIIQCRGYKNKPTEHNATIVNLIQQNIQSLQKLAR